MQSIQKDSLLKKNKLSVRNKTISYFFGEKNVNSLD